MKFDPYAFLEKMRSGAATPATAATPCLEVRPRVASVATVAGVDHKNPQPLPDAEAYVEALRQVGPCGYGVVATFLGWGATRAGNAEMELRLAGRIVYDSSGRGKLTE